MVAGDGVASFNRFVWYAGSALPKPGVNGAKSGFGCPGSPVERRARGSGWLVRRSRSVCLPPSGWATAPPSLTGVRSAGLVTTVWFGRGVLLRSVTAVVGEWCSGASKQPWERLAAQSNRAELHSEPCAKPPKQQEVCLGVWAAVHRNNPATTHQRTR